MCLDETYGKIRINICVMHFLFRIVWKMEMLYRHCFPMLVYNILSGGMELDWTHQLWSYADDISVLCVNIDNKNRDPRLEMLVRRFVWK